MELSEVQKNITVGITQGQVNSFRTFVLQFCADETHTSYDPNNENNSFYQPVCQPGCEASLQKKFIEYRELINFLSKHNLITTFRKPIESDSIYSNFAKESFLWGDWGKYYGDTLVLHYTTTPQLENFVNNGFQFSSKKNIVFLIAAISTIVIAIWQGIRWMNGK
jgi:hypothetical protein